MWRAREAGNVIARTCMTSQCAHAPLWTMSLVTNRRESKVLKSLQYPCKGERYMPRQVPAHQEASSMLGAVASCCWRISGLLESVQSSP